MRKRLLIGVIAAAMGLGGSALAEKPWPTEVRPLEAVPNEAAAVDFAKAALVAHFGEATFRENMNCSTLRATQKSEYWVIKPKLDYQCIADDDKRNGWVTVFPGWSVGVVIAGRDARVLSLYHQAGERAPIVYWGDCQFRADVLFCRGRAMWKHEPNLGRSARAAADESE